MTAALLDPKVSSTLELAKFSFPELQIRTEVALPRAANEVADGLTLTSKSLPVAMAQITTYPGQIAYNTAKAIDVIRKARDAGAKLVVFPELTLTGYAAMDLLFRSDYREQMRAGLEQIRKECHDITVIVGIVSEEPGIRSGGRPRLHNSAAVIQDCRVIHVQDKTLHPNYEIFFEDRYFDASREKKLIEVDGVKIGIEICEDLWNEGYEVDPTQSLVNAGADLIINLSASPFHLGKVPVRERLISGTCKSNGVPFLYTNLVGSFDGFEGDVVFDGASMAFNSHGVLTAMGKRFGEEILLVQAFTRQEMPIPEVPEMADLHDALVLGIKEYFKRLALSSGGRGMKHAIIGLSGGIDSAVVAALAVEALGASNVMGITMPSKFSSSETRGDAELLAHLLGIDFKTVPIGEVYETTARVLRSAPELRDLPEGVAEENLQARIRMIDLMYYANATNGIVLNTGNKTELALNNCTIYGDMVGGFSVLADVDKDRVYELAEYINERAGKEIIPRTTIDRVPTAELKPGQDDSHVMGAHPRLIAPMVRAIVERDLTPAEAVIEFGSDFTEKLIRDVFRKLDRSEWKRRQASPGIRVTPHAFGNGRRYPIGHGFDE